MREVKIELYLKDEDSVEIRAVRQAYGPELAHIFAQNLFHVEYDGCGVPMNGDGWKTVDLGKHGRVWKKNDDGSWKRIQ